MARSALSIEIYIFCIFFVLIRTSSSIDLCTSSITSEILEANFRQGVVPKGAAEVGTVRKDVNAETFLDCVSSCCLLPSCNVMFFYNRTCYLISCNVTWPEACDPETRADRRFSSARWLSLRPIDKFESYAQSSFSSIEDRTVSPLFGLHEECTDNGDCGTNEECRFVSTEASTMQRCECATGFSRDHDTMLCTKSVVISYGETCEMGLLGECPENEHCLSRSGRSRSGYCECVDDYSRHSVSGNCLSDVVEAKSTDTTTSTIESTSIATTVDSGSFTTATGTAATSTTVRHMPSVISTTIPFIRTNKAPVATVDPPHQELTQPNDLVLDGSKSADDVEIVRYLWEVVSKPLDYNFQVPTYAASRPVLVVKNLVPGFYKFKLTVTDSDGLESSAFSEATIIKEVDNPPVADAGRDVVMTMPVKSVTLNGDGSHDDRKIVSYEWTKKSDDSLAADMTGVRTPYLKLDNLQVGLYVFTLKVTDSGGQTSTSEIHVLVRPEENQAPKAVAGSDQTIILPVNVVTLDGRNSTDDKRIESYLWVFISGPSRATVENAHEVVATASNLVSGQYKFQLTVKDESGLESNSVVMVTVRGNENREPIARAGGNLVVTLPVGIVTIDGTASEDVKAIVSYTWTKDELSPAAVNVISNSDHSAVLQLTDVVSGRYQFTLEVKDAEGRSSRDKMSLIVQPDPLELNLVELHLATTAASFTDKQKSTLSEQLSLLLNKDSSHGTTKVVFRRLAEDISSQLTLVTFYAESVEEGQKSVWPGTDVVTSLRHDLSSLEVLGFRVTKFDTVVCQNNCSGHGSCDRATHRCICSGFWMENFSKAYLGEQESNCDWSILYVILVVICVVFISGALLCSFVYLTKRCVRCRPKLKRHRYMLLEERADDEDDEVKGNDDKIRLLPKCNVQSSSLMQSDSDFSSEETIFVNSKRPANGFVGTKQPPNGSLRNGQRSKVKA